MVRPKMTGRSSWPVAGRHRTSRSNLPSAPKSWRPLRLASLTTKLPSGHTTTPWINPNSPGPSPSRPIVVTSDPSGPTFKMWWACPSTTYRLPLPSKATSPNRVNCAHSAASSPPARQTSAKSQARGTSCAPSNGGNRRGIKRAMAGVWRLIAGR